MRIKRVDRSYYEEGYTFACPGCKHTHVIPVRVSEEQIKRRGSAPPCWDFNGSMDSPTFSPSLLVTGTEHLTDEEIKIITSGAKFEPRRYVCHSFIRDGKIQFLSDCTHSLAGQTVDLSEELP